MANLLREWKAFVARELGSDVGTDQFSSASLNGKTLRVERPLVAMQWVVDAKDPRTGGRQFVAFFKDDGVCEWSPLHDQEEFGSPEAFEELQALLGIHSQTDEENRHFVKTMTETVFDWMAAFQSNLPPIKARSRRDDERMK